MYKHRFPLNRFSAFGIAGDVSILVFGFIDVSKAIHWKWCLLENLFSSQAVLIAMMTDDDLLSELEDTEFEPIKYHRHGEFSFKTIISPISSVKTIHPAGKLNHICDREKCNYSRMSCRLYTETFFFVL